jgi:hypothetical protein
MADDTIKTDGNARKNEQTNAERRARRHDPEYRERVNAAWREMYHSNHEYRQRRAKAKSSPENLQRRRDERAAGAEWYVTELARAKVRRKTPEVRKKENDQRRKRLAARPELREQANARRRNSPEYRKHDAQRVNEYRKARQDKPEFALAWQLRTRIYGALKGKNRGGSAVRDLGCSIEEFKRHIERQFQKGMTWDNWGRGVGKWHLDHIRPLASFDLTDPDQFRQAAHFTNYRPLWGKENAAKRDRRTLLL